MKRPPAWSKSKRDHGELSARLAWPTPKRLAELSELSCDPRLPPETEAKVAGWIDEAKPDAYQVGQAIEELRKRIGNAEGRQTDMFTATEQAPRLNEAPAHSRRRHPSANSEEV